jgi:hypothetical protein
MKRLAIAGAVGALLCAPTHPAGAQNPTVTAKVVGVSNRQIVSGTIAVVGKGSSPAGVDEVSIDVDNLVTAKEKPSGLTQEADVRYEWNTAIVTGSSQIASNGEYVVRVRATDKAGSTDSASVTILVDNAPSIPSGVSAFVDGATVKVTWATNAEPDIVGYVVERDSGVGFVAVAQTTEPAFAEALDPGSYSYRVTALRKSPSAEGVHASAASAVVTAVVSAPKSSSSGSGGRGPGSKDERPLDVVRHKFSERGLPSGIAISRRARRCRGATMRPSSPTSCRRAGCHSTPPPRTSPRARRGASSLRTG